MNKTFFHVCPVVLEVGSIIKPGNWGRVIYTYTMNSHWYLPIRELCYENVRLKLHPHKPSRLLSMFVFPSHALAHNFAQVNNPTNLIYEVELIDSSAPFFHGDMVLLDPQPAQNSPVIPFLMNQAEKYWTGIDEISNTSEFLTYSGIRVIAD